MGPVQSLSPPGPWLSTHHRDTDPQMQGAELGRWRRSWGPGVRRQQKTSPTFHPVFIVF